MLFYLITCVLYTEARAAGKFCNLWYFYPCLQSCIPLCFFSPTIVVLVMRSLLVKTPSLKQLWYRLGWHLMGDQPHPSGEGNGNPLQYSCLENPKDWGAWWATVYGVAQSRTWMKWLSSSRNLTRHSFIHIVREKERCNHLGALRCDLGYK